MTRGVATFSGTNGRHTAVEFLRCVCPGFMRRVRPGRPGGSRVVTWMVLPGRVGLMGNATARRFGAVRIRFRRIAADCGGGLRLTQSWRPRLAISAYFTGAYGVPDCVGLPCLPRSWPSGECVAGRDSTWPVGGLDVSILAGFFDTYGERVDRFDRSGLGADKINDER